MNKISTYISKYNVNTTIITALVHNYCARFLEFPARCYSVVFFCFLGFCLSINSFFIYISICCNIYSLSSLTRSWSSTFSAKYAHPYPVASGRISEPPQPMSLPVRAPSKFEQSRLYWPKRNPISRVPTPISPAGTSREGPICFANSVIKLWEKIIIIANTNKIKTKHKIENKTTNFVFLQTVHYTPDKKHNSTQNWKDSRK